MSVYILEKLQTWLNAGKSGFVELRVTFLVLLLRTFQHPVWSRPRPHRQERGGRAGGRRSLTCLGRRVLLASLEGVPEQQLIAPAARAHQDHADGACVVAHAAAGGGGPAGTG